MRRGSRPVPVILAVLAAMFAFAAAAAAEDEPAGLGTADGRSSAAVVEVHADESETGNARTVEETTEARPFGEAGAEADGPPIGVKAPSSAADDGSSGFAMAGGIDGLEPYKLIRSLQFVQDSVVQGDHSAMEMQRFLLGVIDKRLRQAEQQVFDDPRNVDAALIYAMSGGNPETLEILAIRDKFGNFDNEVTTVLRAYLNGQAAKTRTTLDEVVEIYRDTEIGPFLTLVAANVMAATNDVEALEMFDWARLTAPGTLVEEAALRRSLFIAVRKDLVDRALDYAQLYARRFINSPYAGQYADLLVDLVVVHYGKVGDERLNQILSFMDTPRKREVFLRIARKANISGHRELAVFASDKADSLLTPTDKVPQALADLYSGMAKIPTDGVAAVMESINAVSNGQLSSRDQALRQAALMIAGEVIRKPDPNSLTQAFSPKVAASDTATAADSQLPEDSVEAKPAAPDISPVAASEEEEAVAQDNVFQEYVSSQKQALERIDKLLDGIKEDKGS